MGYNEVIDRLYNHKEIIAIALGGSRSRGQHKIDADYDLFCVINDNHFNDCRKSFSNFLEKIPEILFAAEVFYLENWGYLFKAVDLNNTKYDISIISKSRIAEMGIRSTNIIIKDTNKLYQSCVAIAEDDQFLVSRIEREHLNDYATLFGFERNRFFEAIKETDYWYAVRCLERMKNYLIRCDRIQTSIFSKSCSCPERGYMDANDCLKKIYIMDGTIDRLIITSEELNKYFCTIIHDINLCMRSQLSCEKQ